MEERTTFVDAVLTTCPSQVLTWDILSKQVHKTTRKWKQCWWQINKSYCDDTEQPMPLPTMRSSISANAVWSLLPRSRKSSWATLTFHSSDEQLNFADTCLIASYAMSNLQYNNLFHSVIIMNVQTQTYTKKIHWQDIYLSCLYDVSITVLASERKHNVPPQ